MYEELVDRLRDEDNCNILDYVDEAAEAIEKLKYELEQVKAERDAAVEDLKSQYDIQGIEDDHPIYDMSICFKCIYYPSSFNRYCEDCNNFDKWQWRGVQGGKGND